MPPINARSKKATIVTGWRRKKAAVSSFGGRTRLGVYCGLVGRGLWKP